MEQEMVDLEVLSKTEKLFSDEANFIGDEYLFQPDIDIRRQIVSMIDRLSKSRRDLDAFEPYLAMTYFDQFWLKENKIILIESTFFDTAKVYAIAFMSLACKMRKSKFSVDNFIEVDGTLYWNINRQAFLETEIYILNVLEWRMKPLTAFSFMEYFSPFFKLRDQTNPFVDKGIRRLEISKIIVKFKGDFRLSRYKPSIIAASAFFVVAESIMPKERLDEIRVEISRIRKHSPESYLAELMQCQMHMKASLNLEDPFPLIPRDSNAAESSSGTHDPPRPILLSKSIPEFDVVEEQEEVMMITPRNIDKGKSILRGGSMVENMNWPITATDDEDLLMEFRINWPKVVDQVVEERATPPATRSASEAVSDCFVNCCNYFCTPWIQNVSDDESE